jgi:predicted nucleotidyltransferase
MVRPRLAHSSVSAALFGSYYRQKSLALLYLTAPAEYHVAGIAKVLGFSSASGLSQELRKLALAGLIRKRELRGQTVYQANMANPVYKELRALLVKTDGMVPALRAALTPLAHQIQGAFVFGSTAKAADRADSDVDLIIVGKVKMIDVLEALTDVETFFGRELNPTIYLPAEYAELLAKGDPFLSDISGKQRIDLLTKPDARSVTRRSHREGKAGTSSGSGADLAQLRTKRA